MGPCDQFQQKNALKLGIATSVTSMRKPSKNFCNAHGLEHYIYICLLNSIKHGDDEKPTCEGAPMDIPVDSSSSIKVTYTYSVKFKVSLFMETVYGDGWKELYVIELISSFFSKIMKLSGLLDGITFWCPCLTATSSGSGEHRKPSWLKIYNTKNKLLYLYFHTY